MPNDFETLLPRDRASAAFAEHSRLLDDVVASMVSLRHRTGPSDIDLDLTDYRTRITACLLQYGTACADVREGDVKEVQS